MSAPARRAAIPQAPAAALAEIDGPAEFGRIADPGVAAALWRRTAPHGAQDWLDALAPGIARGHAPMLSMRIEPVADDACRRFHIDAVPLRLVCALRGRGAQYGAGTPGAQPDRIEEAPPGAVLLLRGKGWPGGAPAFLHRSPPIEGSGETRLLFVLDLPGGARA